MAFAVADIPQIEERTPEAVAKWLQALSDKGILWHMDDSPHDIETFKGIEDELSDLQMDAILICEEAGTGIWDLPIWKKLLAEIEKEGA